MIGHLLAGAVWILNEDIALRSAASRVVGDTPAIGRDSGQGVPYAGILHELRRFTLSLSVSRYGQRPEVRSHRSDCVRQAAAIPRHGKVARSGHSGPLNFGRLARGR